MSVLFIFLNKISFFVKAGLGGKSSLLFLGLGVSLLAALGLAQCRQTRIEDLSARLAELDAAHAGQLRAIEELFQELDRRDGLLLAREEAKNAVNRELQTARSGLEAAARLERAERSRRAEQQIGRAKQADQADQQVERTGQIGQTGQIRQTGQIEQAGQGRAAGHNGPESGFCPEADFWFDAPLPESVLRLFEPAPAAAPDAGGAANAAGAALAGHPDPRLAWQN